MRKLGLFGLLFFMISCSNENSTNGKNQDFVMTGYTETSKRPSCELSSKPFESIITANLKDGKLYSFTSEEFLDGNSIEGPITKQWYFYNNGLLVSSVLPLASSDFFYDSQRRLIGMRITPNSNAVSSEDYRHYRFSYVSDKIVYCEGISLPYTDPNAQVYSRFILEFDDNDNVIKAGSDINLDGIMENINHFTYVKDNLTTASYYDGSEKTFQYSSVVDNYSTLYDYSFGKKVNRISCFQSFCVLYNELIKYPAKNISLQDSQQSTFQALPNNYYKTKTEIRNSPDSDCQYTVTTEYFFKE